MILSRLFYSLLAVRMSLLPYRTFDFLPALHPVLRHYINARSIGSPLPVSDLHPFLIIESSFPLPSTTRGSDKTLVDPFFERTPPHVIPASF